MPSFRRQAAQFALAALALAASEIAAAPTTAPPQNDGGIVAAAAQVRAALASTGPETDPPMLNNAQGTFVRTAFNLNTMRTMPLDLELVGNACVAIGETIIAYAEFAQRMGANAPNPAAAQNAQIVKLHDELALGSAAANLCVQRGFRAVSQAVTDMPAERHAAVIPALKQMRDGATQTIGGTLDSLLLGMTPANRTMMLSAVREDAPMVARSFPARERESLREKVLAQQVLATPADRAQLTAIAQAFAAVDCNVLCMIAGSN